MEHKEFVKEYVQALINGNAAIFIGSGFSRDSGLPTWSDLLKESARDIGVIVNKESNLVTLAQYIKNKKNGRAITKIIKDKIVSCHAKPVEKHKTLAKLPIRSYWTTNYDNLIETALRNANRVPDIKYLPRDLAQNNRKADAIVYKMHGDANHSDSIILTRDDYESYHRDKELFSTKLKSELLEKTFLFVGFSFDDPNIMYIMSNLRILLKGEKTNHYWIIRREKKTDEEDIDSYTQRLRLQELQIEDLKRYGINAVMVDEFSEIDDIIKRIEKLYKSKNIFVSGAAANFEPYEYQDAEQLISELVIDLLKNGNKIINGFGVGVGDFVINAVISYMDAVKAGKYTDDRVLDIKNFLDIQPFPQNIANKRERKRCWTKCRRSLIEKAGVAIFLFGNKIKKENRYKKRYKLLFSKGMDEELQIAKKLNINIIPIPSTGWKAQRYYNKMVESNDASDDLRILGDIPHNNVIKIARHVSLMVENFQG